MNNGNSSISQPDIRLGDVVVSRPDGTSGGIIQVDLVKATSSSDGEVLQRKGFLNSPPMALRTALAKIRSGESPSIRSPSRLRDPEVGGNRPARQLKRVVMPAPFGPIRPVIVPFLIVKDTSSTARLPPKVLVIDWAVSMSGTESPIGPCCEGGDFAS